MATERKQFNGEAPTVEAGRRLFLDGGTLDNADRFRRMKTNDQDLTAYFKWEADSLVMFAATLPPRFSPEDGSRVMCAALKSTGITCFGPIGEMGDGRRKCVICGAVQ